MLLILLNIMHKRILVDSFSRKMTSAVKRPFKSPTCLKVLMADVSTMPELNNQIVGLGTRQTLENLLKDALSSTFNAELSSLQLSGKSLIEPSTKPEFGDYQVISI